MKQIFYDQAPSETKVLYENIKNSLQTSSVPLFFTYLGVFPEYLEFINKQIVANLEDSLWTPFSSQIGHELYTLTQMLRIENEEVFSWRTRYQNTPSFYNLQKDLRRTFDLNVTLALLFLALREAVKGWAVAVKKIDSKVKNVDNKVNSNDLGDKREFIQDGYYSSSNAEFSIQPKDKALQVTGGVEKNLFVDYLKLQELSFFRLVKEERYLYARLGAEKIVLASLPLMPHPIISPINAVYELAVKYPDFPDLLYLLSEEFPTLAVQRVMYSGFLLPSY